MYIPENDGDWRLVRQLGLMMVVMTEYRGDQYHWTTSNLAFSLMVASQQEPSLTMSHLTLNDSIVVTCLYTSCQCTTM